MRKNKKLLLASVAAMGALALGVGATSTFAWFQTTNGVRVAQTSSTSQTMSVTHADFAVGNALIPLTVSIAATSSNDAQVLAHYAASPAGGSAEKLETGYVDTAGKFHAVETDKRLSGLLTITIAIDYTTGWSEGEAGSRTFTGDIDGTQVQISEADVVKGLAGTAAKVELKCDDSGTNNRGRLFKTSAGTTDQYMAVAGATATTTEQGDAPGGYFLVAASSSLAGLGGDVDGQSVSNYGKSITINVTGIKYYVYGGTAADSGSVSDPGDVSVDNIFARITNATN